MQNYERFELGVLIEKLKHLGMLWKTLDEPLALFRLVGYCRGRSRSIEQRRNGVDSMAGVGTQKVFENDRVIVWHLDLGPGEYGERHTHELDFVVRVLSGSTQEVGGPTGELLYTVEREAGEAVSFRMDGNRIVSDRPGNPAVPATHCVHNIGANTFREVLIEFKN
jgi:hypothetical protein